MTLDQIKTALDIVITILTLPTLIFTLINTVRIHRVRQEQNRVAAALDQVQKDGLELRKFLDAQNKKESSRVLKP